MAQKIIARSNNGSGNMLKIEDKTSSKGYVWYFMTQPVVDFVNGTKIVPNDEIEFTSEEIKGEDTITRVTKIGGSSSGTGSSAGKFYEKSPEVQESIKRQAIGHMVSRTIKGLQGVDLNNINTVIDSLYKKYQEVVG